ncbi:MAG: hypothetical protein EB084_16825 [Proteobacteria bacterium]|nr:hypothetical protein [Pseudomonadota bacterium]
MLHDKGEVISHAADALVEAEMVIESHKSEAKADDLNLLREKRDQTLEQIFSDHPEHATATAAQMRAIAQEWGKVDETLRQKVEYLVKWADGHLNYYGWAYESERLALVRQRIDEARKALLPNAEDTLQLHHQMLDAATNNPPPVVHQFYALYDVLSTRVEPRSPARAQHFREELKAVRGRFVARDGGAEKHLREVTDAIHHAAADSGVALAEPVRECATCGQVLKPGARYCASGHDSWLLREGASEAGEEAFL